jgi:aminopeptidase-like protein
VGVRRAGLEDMVGVLMGGGSSQEPALLWVLNLPDGSASLLDIARRSGLPFSEIRDAAVDTLAAHALLEPRI